MGLLRDYFASDYSIVVAYGLPFIWIIAIGLIQKKKKAKNFNIFKSSWWFWTISILLVANIFFTLFNSTFFGIATPEYFVEMHITDEEVILFDNKVTYYDDDNTNTDDYSSHLRIHVVDRKSHSKRYEDLIGTNYFTFIDTNEVFILKYTGYSSGYIKEVYTYNIESQELESIVAKGGTIQVDNEKVEAYEILGSLGIVVTSKTGEKYIYNSLSKSFENFNGTYLHLDKEEELENDRSIYLAPEQAGSDRYVLHVNRNATEHVFVIGTITQEFIKEQHQFVLIESYEDLTQENKLYAFFNSKGSKLWELKMTDLEKKVGSSGFETIQLFQIYNEVIYFTINAYLFEMDFERGNINWWLKL